MSYASRDRIFDDVAAAGSEEEELLTSTEVAALFGVDRRTVVLWAKHGRMSTLRTPGGHHRFRAREVRRLLRHEQA